MEDNKKPNENEEKNVQSRNIESMAPYVNEKIKYYILAIAALLALIVIFIVVHEANNKSETPSASSAITQEESNPVPMQFVYLVTQSDSNYDEYMAMVDELEAEYGDQIIFDIKDIDENPEERDNFPVDAFGTPLLIIVNDEGGFTAIEGKCADKEKIVEYIEKTLENRKYPDATFDVPAANQQQDK